jgi:hypothetical protein
VSQQSRTPAEYAAMVKRMAASGLSAEQIAQATGLPLAVVREMLAARSWVRR